MTLMNDGIVTITPPCNATWVVISLLLMLSVERKGRILKY